MSAPLILITPGTVRRGIEFADASLNLSNQYCMAVAAAGGLPWVAACLPAPALVRESVARCDGVLLTGGDDIEPRLYAPRLKPALRRTVAGVDRSRDLFELLVIHEVFRQRKPLFAICRGHQIVNVAFGGTLVVDIASEVPGGLNHRQIRRKNEVVHDVALTEGSLIANIVRQTQLGVNSSHHQAVARVAGPFQVTAQSADNVIEAMELAPAAATALPFFLAVQFHPERLYARHPAHLALFASFISACATAKRV